jgi:hypothetical protein
MQVIIAVLIILGLGMIAVAVVTVMGTATNPSGLGFTRRHFGTGWSILIVPVLLTWGGVLIAAYQDIRQQAIEDQRAERQRELEYQRARDVALQEYLDLMTQ